MVTSQLLEISKQLATSPRSFTVTFKTKDIDFSFSSQGKDDNPKHPGHEKKKSPSQKKRDFQRRKHFLENKLEKSNLSLKICDDDNTVMNHTEEVVPPFKCDDCDFEGISIKGLGIHRGKQHKIGAQIDGIEDEDLKEDVVCRLMILISSFFKDKLQMILMMRTFQLEKLSGPFQKCFTLTILLIL